MRKELDSVLPLQYRDANLRRSLSAAKMAMNRAENPRPSPVTEVERRRLRPVGAVDEMSESLFRLIFERCPIGMAVLDEAGRWLLVNQACCAVFGEEESRLAATSLLELAGPEDREGLRAILAGSLPGKFASEWRFRHRQQGSIWVRLHLTTSALGAGSAPVRICQVEDVTGQRLELDDQERERRLLFKTIATSPIAVALFDTSMRYLTHSDRWLQMHEMSGDSLIGRSHYEVVPDLPERWKEVHRRCLAGEVITAEEDRFEGADGQVHYHRWAVHPWQRTDGQIGGVIILADRIDDLIHAREAALEASRLKSQFLSTMSHEVRTPMNGILGMVHLLLETNLTSEQHELASTLSKSGHILLSLINDIFEFSRIESGNLTLHNREYHLPQLLAEVAHALAPSARARGIELSCEIPAGLPEWYEGDPDRLHQVLLKLVGNAIKFTEEGAVRIEAALIERKNSPGPADAPCTLRLSVHDTGIGIAADRRPFIFDSFTQGDSSVSRLYGGTGLGLSICQKVAQLLGGTITLASELGRGSSFHLELPLAQPPRTAESDEVGDSSDRPLAGETVVVADGDGPARARIRRQLERWGGEVFEANTARGALGLLKSAAAARSPVLLIAEPLLAADPQSSRQLDERAALAEVPVVFMATTSTRGPAARLDRLAIIRPFSSSSLLDVIDRAIRAERPSSGPASGPATRKRANSGKLEGVRILLAEDNATNQMVAVRMLKRLGCVAEVVADGAAVLTQLGQADFDLVLMDVQMPRMDGYQTTREIRRLERNGSIPDHLPVIAMTANAMHGDRERCLAAEMDDYLSKPVSMVDLSAMLQRWVGRREPVADCADSPSVSAAPTVPAPPTLRVARLQELSQGDFEFEKELLSCLLIDISNGMNRLRDALEPLDPLQVANTLHGIVGACRTVGADELGMLCRERENQAREPGFGPDPSWMASIERKRDALVAAVTARIQP